MPGKVLIYSKTDELAKRYDQVCDPEHLPMIHLNDSMACLELLESQGSGINLLIFDDSFDSEDQIYRFLHNIKAMHPHIKCGYVFAYGKERVAKNLRSDSLIHFYLQHPFSTCLLASELLFCLEGKPSISIMLNEILELALDSNCSPVAEYVAAKKRTFTDQKFLSYGASVQTHEPDEAISKVFGRQNMQKLSNRKIEPNATILFDFLGCKLNKYEIELMRTQAEQMGLTPLIDQDIADVIVINTCSVTNQASRDSRKKIRRYRRSNEDAFIVVTGCYAQTDPDEVEAMEIDLLLSNFEKEKFHQFVGPEIEGYNPKSNIETALISKFEFQSRPFLKVQDGCDAYCSYCIIPRARGRSRSLDRETVLSQVRELSQVYPELVLSGVNLGQYSDGINYGFFELLRDICDVEALQQIRISSLEPLDLSDELLQYIVAHPKICKHLHLSLQGAEDNLLKMMRRKYSYDYYRSRIEQIKELDEDFCIGTDVIVGFPGETQEIFDTCLKNLQDTALNYFHVFPFSSRAKTVAEKLPDHLDGPTKKARARILNDLSRQKKADFLASQVGKTHSAVIERNAGTNSFYKGLTSNYLPVIIEKSGPEDLSLQKVNVLIEEVSESKVLGKLEVI